MTEKTDHKVTWVCVDDWHALYVDGKQVGEQSSSASPSPWTWESCFKALGIEFESQRYTELAERLAEDLGRFPETWPPEES